MRGYVIIVLIILILYMIGCLSEKRIDHFVANNIIFLERKHVLDVWKKSIYLQTFNKRDIINRKLLTDDIVKWYSDRTLNFTCAEKHKLKNAISIIKKKASGNPKKWKFINRYTWKFAKLDNSLEFGFPHTHSDIIFLPERFLDLQLNDYFLETIVHEMVHVWQRKSPLRFQNLYSLNWKFTKVHSICGTKKYLRSMRTNPDIDHIFYIFDNKIFPISAFDNDNQIQYIGIPVKYENSYKVDDSEKVKNLNDLPEYSEYFGIQGNHYHPNELSAEMIANMFIGKTNNSEGAKNLSNWLVTQN